MSSLCIVIPCYNEANRFPVAEFERYFHSSAYSFYFVNDGSKDKTGEMLEELKKGREERIRVENLAQNSGKAEAVRAGMLAALSWKNFEYVAYWDADLATPFSEISLLLDYLEQDKNLHFAVGARVKRLGTQVQRSPMRHYLGRIFSTFASLTLNLAVYDTQCGAKIMSSAWIPAVFQEKFLSRWLFDVEIFARIMQLYGKDKAETAIIEVPLRVWIEKGDSRLGLSNMLKAPWELWKIGRRYRL